MKNHKFLTRILVGLFFVFSLNIKAFSQNKDEKNVVYKYKSYEKFDLGDMSIKGDVITPGDISVKKRQFRRFRQSLYHRYNFADKVKEDFKDLR